MVQRVFTADLLSNQPPYNPRELGSSVVFADARETAQRAPGANHGTDATQQQGYNQVYYMENVMPSARGITSVGYQSTVPQKDTLVPEYVLECRASDGGLTYVAIAGSRVLHWQDESGWQLYPSIYAMEGFVPQAVVVRGQSYFYFGTFIVYTWNSVSKTLVPSPTNGVDLGAILGICSGGSQLVLYSASTIYYSGVLDATDFLPSLATGAGSTGVLALKGTIVCCLPLGQDFVIYTQFSAVHARYTANFALPFVYNEIPGSTGIITQKHVAYNTNSGSHIVYANVGMQEVTPSGVSPIFPDISDQIAKGVMAGIDPLTDLISYESVQAINVKLAFVANRWLFISLGTDPSVELFTEAYAFDTTLRRFGRLKVTHTCLFEWAGSAAVEGIKTYQDLANTYPTYGDTAGTLYRDLGSLAAKYSALNKQKISIMSHLGQVCLLVATESGQLAGDNVGTDAAMPRALIGRIKLFREQGAIVQWVRLNKLVQGNLVLIGHDYNGAPIKRVEGLIPSKLHAGTFSKKMNADSLSVEVRGHFVLTDLSIAATSGGTHKQYAAATKKFERLLYSPIYSIEGVETYAYNDTQVTYGRQFGVDVPVDEQDYTNNCEVIGGLLRNATNEITQYDVELFTQSLAVSAGQLRTTLIAHSVYSPETYRTHLVVQAGSLPMVLIAHDQPIESGQQYRTNLTIQSGSLV